MVSLSLHREFHYHPPLSRYDLNYVGRAYHKPSSSSDKIGYLSASVDQITGFDPHQAWQYSFVEIDHEIFSAVIFILLLIQDGQL